MSQTIGVLHQRMCRGGVRSSRRRTRSARGAATRRPPHTAHAETQPGDAGGQHVDPRIACAATQGQRRPQHHAALSPEHRIRGTAQDSSTFGINYAVATAHALAPPHIQPLSLLELPGGHHSEMAQGGRRTGAAVRPALRGVYLAIGWPWGVHMAGMSRRAVRMPAPPAAARPHMEGDAPTSRCALCWGRAAHPAVGARGEARLRTPRAAPKCSRARGPPHQPLSTGRSDVQPACGRRGSAGPTWVGVALPHLISSLLADFPLVDCTGA
jgi:hypothetical protein